MLAYPKYLNRSVNVDMVFARLCLYSPPPLGIFTPPPPPPRFRVSCNRSSSQIPLSPVHKTISQIESSGVIACLRADSAKLAMEAATAAISAGISVVLQQLVWEHPTMTLGVGTVLNAKDAKHAINVGAKFLMSPAMVKDIMDDVKGDEVLYIPGVMTPTEILSAFNAGAKIVKVYPVSALGGIQYISALKKPFTHIPMIASQGITIDSIEEYIAQGASAVVLSDAIFDKMAMGQNDINAICQLAQLAASQGNEAVQRRKMAMQN